MNQNLLFRAAVVASVSFTLLCSRAAASTFTFQENADLVPQEIEPSVQPIGNALNIENIAAVTHLGDTTTEPVFYTYPFIYAGITPEQIVTLGWDNSLNAYTNDNYDGQGNRVNLRLPNFTERIRLGDVADLTGTSPFPLMVPCSDSPSCPPEPAPGPPLPSASQDADDSIPALSLGTFAPGETKSLDAIFSFEYEDDRTGPLRFLPLFGILSEVPSGEADTAPVSVPEPMGVAGLLAACLTVGLKRSVKKQ